jgi:hypothetical protein
MEDERQKIVAARLQRLGLLEPLLDKLPEPLRVALQKKPLDKYAEKLVPWECHTWTDEGNALGSVLENIGLSWGQIADFLGVKRTTYKDHFRKLKNPPDPKLPAVRATAVEYFGALPFERQTKLFFSLFSNQREALLALLPEPLQGSLRSIQGSMPPIAPQPQPAPIVDATVATTPAATDTYSEDETNRFPWDETNHFPWDETDRSPWDDRFLI